MYATFGGQDGRDGLAANFQAVTDLAERTPAEVQTKERRYAALRSEGSAWWTLKVACDLWTSAFFLRKRMPERDGDNVPTTDGVRRAVFEPDAAYGPLIDAALQASQAHPFFHWPMEFPEVFATGGFDVVLGNPPWDKIEMDEQEFFAGREPRIARLAGARCKAAIADLEVASSRLWREFQLASRQIAARTAFAKSAKRFQLTGLGRLNLYALFAELDRTLLNNRGRCGVLVPTGIANRRHDQAVLPGPWR